MVGQPETYHVYINIYDVLANGNENMTAMIARINKIGRELGLGGVFHGAIQIDNYEWSFGWCPSGSGVYVVEAKKNPMYQFRETVDLGHTTKSKQEIKAIIHALKAKWQGPSYELLSRNCCHFCDAFATQLEVQPIPAWVNRFASSAEATAMFYNDAVAMARQVSSSIRDGAANGFGWLRESVGKMLSKSTPAALTIESSESSENSVGTTATSTTATTTVSVNSTGKAKVVHSEQFTAIAGIGKQAIPSQASSQALCESASITTTSTQSAVSQRPATPKSRTHRLLQFVRNEREQPSTNTSQQSAHTDSQTQDGAGGSQEAASPARRMAKQFQRFMELRRSSGNTAVQTKSDSAISAKKPDLARNSTGSMKRKGKQEDDVKHPHALRRQSTSLEGSSCDTPNFSRTAVGLYNDEDDDDDIPFCSGGISHATSAELYNVSDGRESDDHDQYAPHTKSLTRQHCNNLSMDGMNGILSSDAATAFTLTAPNTGSSLTASYDASSRPVSMSNPREDGFLLQPEAVRHPAIGKVQLVPDLVTHADLLGLGDGVSSGSMCSDVAILFR